MNFNRFHINILIIITIYPHNNKNKKYKTIYNKKKKIY